MYFVCAELLIRLVLLGIFVSHFFLCILSGCTFFPMFLMIISISHHVTHRFSVADRDRWPKKPKKSVS